MEMSVGDIILEYNQAKYKSKQIGILADLNCTSADEIRKILKDHGVIGAESTISSVQGGEVAAKKGVKSTIEEDEEPKSSINAVQNKDSSTKNVVMTGISGGACVKKRIKSVPYGNGIPKTVLCYIHERIEELHALEAACRRIITLCTEEYGELREFMTANGVDE